jgi:hypothetical protein
MECPAGVSSHKEFEDWLALALESERRRLRQESAQRDSAGGLIFDPTINEREKEAQYEDE